MTGVNSYSTTASENVSSNTGINWDEGMPPASVNNSARQNMADMRAQWNDASWFQYGVGSKNVAHVYASGISTTLSSPINATDYWHVGRRVRAVGSATGTIYGKVASSSFAANVTTVHYTWDSGSLSNETLAVYASTTPVTGNPIPLATGSGGVPGVASPTFTGTISASIINVNSAPGNAVLSAAAGNSGGAAVEGFFNGASGRAFRAQVDQATAHLVSFYYSTNAVGSITTDTTSTAYNTSSDERLKENIQDAGEAGSIIDALRVRSWVWKDGGKFERFGFVAQEEYRVAPFAVTQGNDTKPWGRDDSKLVPVLVKEIQSLRARIAALEAR